MTSVAARTGDCESGSETEGAVYISRDGEEEIGHVDSAFSADTDEDGEEPCEQPVSRGLVVAEVTVHAADEKEPVTAGDGLEEAATGEGQRQGGEGNENGRDNVVDNQMLSDESDTRDTNDLNKERRVENHEKRSKEKAPVGKNSAQENRVEKVISVGEQIRKEPRITRSLSASCQKGQSNLTSWRVGGRRNSVGERRQSNGDRRSSDGPKRGGVKERSCTQRK